MAKQWGRTLGSADAHRPTRTNDARHRSRSTSSRPTLRIRRRPPSRSWGRSSGGRTPRSTGTIRQGSRPSRRRCPGPRQPRGGWRCRAWASPAASQRPSERCNPTCSKAMKAEKDRETLAEGEWITHRTGFAQGCRGAWANRPNRSWSATNFVITAVGGHARRVRSDCGWQATRCPVAARERARSVAAKRPTTTAVVVLTAFDRPPFLAAAHRLGGAGFVEVRATGDAGRRDPPGRSRRPRFRSF